jgi:hypothetical protein
MDQPTAEKALRQLDILVGEWTLERAHLVQRGTVDHPDAPDNISIIGCDAAVYAEGCALALEDTMALALRPD